MAAYVALLLIATIISIVYPTVSAVSAWPKGTYTLPMAANGCANNLMYWKTGRRYQDTEDLFPNNQWSDPFHLKGNWGKAYMEQYFCSKTDYETLDSDPEWGTGEYCIYKKGTSCPDDFSEGWILWDDQDLANRNDYSGELPEGVYDDDTKIYFCCREDGDVGTPLVLPVEEPFFLFRKNGVCQSVDQMTLVEEWFRWDGDDDLIDLNTYRYGSVPYLDSILDNHKLIYCYYY